MDMIIHTFKHTSIPSWRKRKINVGKKQELRNVKILKNSLDEKSRLQKYISDELINVFLR